MNVSLGQVFEDYVRKLVSSGRYNNASEVVRDALRLKMQADEEQAARLHALRSDIDEAREQVRRGKVIETSAEAFLNRTKRRHG